MTLIAESQAREDARRKAAADWLQRLDDPALPEADLQAWLHWHGQSEQNRKAFEEIQTLYRQLRDLPGDYRRELRQRFGHTDALYRRPWLNVWALAATVLLTVSGVLKLRDSVMFWVKVKVALPVIEPVFSQTV